MATKTIETHKDPAEVATEAFLRLLWLILKGAIVVAWWALLFPMFSIPIAAAVTAGLFLGWAWAVAVAGVSIAGIMLWRWQRPEMFERWITARARVRFLRWWRYRRCWDQKLKACGLTVAQQSSTFIPRLIDAKIGDTVDRLRVRMLPGQCPDDYENRAERLAHTFGALECRATVIGPGVMELLMRQSDSLAEPVAVSRIADARWRKDAA